MLVVFAAALVGGRLGFVFGQWSYFQEDRPKVWQSGREAFLSWRLIRRSGSAVPLDSRTTAAPSIPMPRSFLPVWRWWLFLAGWPAGSTAALMAGNGDRSFAADLPDEFGVFALRYQTQLLGFLLSLAAFLHLVWLLSGRPAGSLCSGRAPPDFRQPICFPALLRGDSASW